MKLLRYSLTVPVLVATAHATQYLTVEQAQRALFAAATSFAEKKVSLRADQLRQIEIQSRSSIRLKRFRIWQALAHGQQLGYVIVDEVYGKHEFITYALGLDPSGSIIGVEILDYRESYGGEIRSPRWREQFVGKKSQDRFELDKDIFNISGATLSCRHVTEGIRRNLALFHVAVKDQ